MADSSVDNAWVISITNHLKRRDSSTLTIPKVPERLRRGKNDAYEPLIISSGPYHHGKPGPQAMEKYKWSFLEVILSCRPEIPCERYIEAIKEEEAKIRTCHADDFDIDSEEFVEMMLIDGCFLVGYLLQFYYRFRNEMELDLELDLDSIVGMHNLIRYDILLLENQLPFFILIKIFDLLQFTSPSPCPSSFVDLAIKYFNWVAGEEKVNFRPREPVHHLLHLYHSHCLYTQPDGEEPDHPIHQHPSATVHSEQEAPLIPNHGCESDSPSDTDGDESDHQPPSDTDGDESDHQPPSVTSLYEAGVKFKRKKVKGSSINLDVEFDITTGTMLIPPLVIDSSSTPALRNLVAFEQFYPNFSKEFDKSFTAYVEFMDFIVNTPEDVALLHKQGIMRHFLGSDMNVANFFNDLNQAVFVKEDHYLARLYKDVYKYQKNLWPQWWAILMHNYCNSPWAILGIVAGGTLLVLAVLQTILSVLSA